MTSNVVQYLSFTNGIQVNGTTVQAVVDGFGGFSDMAYKYLAEQGIDNLEPKEDTWYDQQAWLNVYRMVAIEIGSDALMEIGKRIPKNAVFPTDIYTVIDGLKSIDVAYHLNHRTIDGVIMYDASREPQMLDGIGHYEYQETNTKNSCVMYCENPYPHAFDWGIILAMAQRFEPHATVDHDETKECREKGGNSCTYIVKW